MSPYSASIRPLSDKIWVTGQVLPGHIEGLREAGFTCLVNHRPDGEEPGQPESAELARVAAAAGLSVVTAPVRGLPDADAVAATRGALDSLGPNGKALMFCRSGMRSAAAWAMAERLAGAEPEALRDAAFAAGYDLGRLPL